MTTSLHFQFDESEFISRAWPRLSDQFKSKPMSLESLWLIVEIKQKFSGVFNKERTMEAFDRKKLLDQKLIQDVAEMLMVGFLHKFELKLKF